MFGRNIADRLNEALLDAPVVLLHGARQTGKTTLCRETIGPARPARYLTFDDAAVLAAAAADPPAFIADLQGPVVLDEIQRVPDVLLAIKSQVDTARVPGGFLLTGSTNVLFLPKLADSLAGRMEIVRLWPLSNGEILGVRDRFIDAVFSNRTPRIPSASSGTLQVTEILLRGGYPEAVARADVRRRRAWFGSYLTTLLQRDVRDLARIENLAVLPRLMALIAARSAALVNYAELSRASGLPASSLKRYMALLEHTFLIAQIPAWSTNLGKRLVRSAKLIVTDVGLAAHILGMDEARLREDGRTMGSLLETFVATELLKQATWNDTPAELFHFRSHAADEVDFVLEGPGGRIVGVEVKASTAVTERDFRGLRTLAELAADRFHRGVVLYRGTQAVSFGPNLHAFPIDALWSATP